MKRVTLLGVLLVAVLACTAAFSTPEPAHALMCCDNGGYSTAQYWTMSTTCADAQAQFRAAALPEAQAFCGGPTRVCGASVPNCYTSGSMFVADGFMYFGCKEDCGPILP